jgi:FkbM family methyltransferase
MKNIFKFVLGRKISEKIYFLRKSIIPRQAEKDSYLAELEEFNNRKIFYGNFVSTNDLCFDVGANFGNRIEPLLKLGARVVAVDPQVDCCNYLNNKFGTTIEIVNAGLGETECEKDFFISDASTLSSFSTEWVESVKKTRFKQYNWDKKVKVRMTTLDNLIKKFGVPDFIKIDVEGYELEVLKGLNHSIKMISFEYVVPEHTTSVLNFIERIEKNNKNIECNYSVGESMNFALKSWMSVSEMKNHVISQEFTQTDFGDIYIRTKI